ncbi:nudix hydrolase 8 isoform X2 [Ceratitis capitata]|nr:nudix hydrolase 8 isoform X2 [Ceratitis capitata]
MDAPEGVFRGTIDRFNGVLIESASEHDETTDFAKKLQKSLDYWISIKRRAIWFTVQKEHAAWVPELAKADFEFHHVCTSSSSVVMYRWLPTEEYANIPTFCHTMLGVGGLVVNDNDEVLVVSDRYALIANSWKLPGGYVEPGEELVNAAIREVKEETGIDCVFRTVLSIRHSHGGSFGCSDMYVVVALKPLNLEVHKCEREIAKAKWMPVAEYLQHPDVHETNRHFMRTYLDYNKRGICFTYERAQHSVLKREYALYFMKPIEGHNES